MKIIQSSLCLSAPTMMMLHNRTRGEPDRVCVLDWTVPLNGNSANQIRSNIMKESPSNYWLPGRYRFHCEENAVGQQELVHDCSTVWFCQIVTRGLCHEYICNEDCWSLTIRVKSNRSLRGWELVLEVFKTCSHPAKRIQFRKTDKRLSTRVWHQYSPETTSSIPR